MTRVVGYTRELFAGTDTSSDADQLRQAGATQVFSDAASANPRMRPELGVCLRSLEAGDTLVVTSSARLSHSLGHFVSTMEDLAVAGVRFRSLTEPALATGFGPSEDLAQVWGPAGSAAPAEESEDAGGNERGGRRGSSRGSPDGDDRRSDRDRAGAAQSGPLVHSHRPSPRSEHQRCAARPHSAPRSRRPIARSQRPWGSVGPAFVSSGSAPTMSRAAPHSPTSPRSSRPLLSAPSFPC